MFGNCSRVKKGLRDKVDALEDVLVEAAEVVGRGVVVGVVVGGTVVVVVVVVVVVEGTVLVDVDVEVEVVVVVLVVVVVEVLGGEGLVNM